MDSVHLGQAAPAPPVYRMVPPYNFEKLHLPHLLTPVPVRLEAAAGYRLPGVRGWGHFRGSKRPEVGPVQGIVLKRSPVVNLRRPARAGRRSEEKQSCRP